MCIFQYLFTAIPSEAESPKVDIHIPEIASSSHIFTRSTARLPKNTDSSVYNGCKDVKKVSKYEKSTAGILALVKPCGVICVISEMFTCGGFTCKQ